jgi:hypothetical protein
MFNIDLVFEQVKSLSSKNQGGYISNAEFNQYSAQAERTLLNYYVSMFNAKETIEESLSPFIKTQSFILNSKLLAFPSDYRYFISLGYPWIKNSSNCSVAQVSQMVSFQKVNPNKWNDYRSSSIRGNNINRGQLQCRVTNELIEVSMNTGSVELTYLRLPVYANRAITISVNSDEEVYNAIASTNYEWTERDQNNIIDLILANKGGAIRDVQLSQWVAQKNHVAVNNIL